jgi:transposase
LPAQLKGYAGLTPSERSSGESVKRGGIGETGSSHLRRIVTEFAWAYRYFPRVFAAMRKRQEGPDPEAQSIAY